MPQIDATIHAFSCGCASTFTLQPSTSHAAAGRRRVDSHVRICKERRASQGCTKTCAHFQRLSHDKPTHFNNHTLFTSPRRICDQQVELSRKKLVAFLGRFRYTPSGSLRRGATVRGFSMEHVTMFDSIWIWLILGVVFLLPMLGIDLLGGFTA